MREEQVKESSIRRFTVAEANAMLPLVRSIVSDICSIFTRVTSRRSDLHRLLRQTSRSTGTPYDDEVAESRAHLQEEYDQIWKYREELESLGVVLRQPEEGRIEFPGMLDGQECFYCWQLGEEQVSRWRSADSPNSQINKLPSLENSAS